MVDVGTVITSLVSSSRDGLPEPSVVALDRIGLGHCRRGAIVLPLPSSTPDDVTSRWRSLALGLGRRPFFVDRPIALALGLGLSAESERAHLLIEVNPGFVEAGVVSRGVVISEHLLPGEPESWATLVDVVGSMLIEIDPDHELDIREEGLHLVARHPESELLSRLLAESLGISVLVTDAKRDPVLLGAAQIVQSISHIPGV